ncbi:MAG: hypothetical protein ABSE48_08945 [Verrucomicrobiota bacterium]
MRIIAVMHEPELAINIDGLFRWSDFPPNGYIPAWWKITSSSLMLAVGWAAIHTQLRLVIGPIENDLVGSVGHSKVGRISLGYDCDVNWWSVCLLGGKSVIAGQHSGFGASSKHQQ